MLKDMSDLTSSLASVGWVVLAFIAFFTFKKQIAGLFSRMTKITIAGQEIELDEAVKKLEDNVEKSSQEVPEMVNTSDNTSILQSTSDPKMGIIAVAIDLEKTIKTLYASLGMLNERNYVAPQQALEIMVQKGYIPKHTAISLEIFGELRNAIVHGKDNSDEKVVIRVLDTGMMLLQTLKSIPHETNIVYHPDVDLYSDDECKKLVTDAKGLMLETISPGGIDKNFRIFPTTKINYYVKGKQVSWEWNLGKVWQRTWYIDPKTKKIKIAWDSAGEFIGRHIEEV